MLDRKQARNWFGTVVLGVLGWALVWSSGILVSQGRTAYAPLEAVIAEMAPINQQLDVRHSFIEVAEAVLKRFQVRADSLFAAVPDSLPLSQLTTNPLKPSVIRDAIRAAGEDSVAVASLRALSLTPGQLFLIESAEKMLGAERRRWRRLSLLPRTKTSAVANQTLVDSFVQASDEYSLALEGYSGALEHSFKFTEQQRQDRKLLVARRDAAFREAKLLTQAAIFLFPISLIGLVVLYRFAAGGKWSLPFGKGTPPA